MQEVLATPTALWTLPELDHYESRSGHTQLSYVGALSDSAGTAFYPWPEQRSGAAKKRVVMYARQEHSGVKELINALCQRDDVALRAYVPGVQVRLNPPNPDIVFSQTPLELSKMLVGADLFIGYAGASTSALALQLGVPMLFLPQHAEQFSTAHRLHLAGVAEWLRPERGSIPFALMLEKVLNNTQAKIRAEQIAQTHTDKPIAESAARLVHNIQSTPTRAN
jgi:UDP:flavonoid glycosyltransferase YjiC (YdhE family)